MDIITTTGVSKKFVNHQALSQVSISIPEGTIFGLLGPNGAGKTTFIRIINQIIAPDEGKILLMGRDLRRDDISKIGYLPEERGLYKKMNVGEQALYLARLKGLSRHDAMQRLKYWFEKFEITSWWNRKVEELSKGMQQKVQFLVTIIHEPPLLIFDEPFSGFDPINANLLKEEILALRKKGSTVIFSTHNMGSVEELCDDIALINKSRVVLSGKVWDIRKTYKTNLFSVSYLPSEKEVTEVLPPDYAVSEKKNHPDHSTVRIQIPEESDPNRMITLLLPHFQLVSFHEIIPGMNDIFIKAVTQPHNS